MRILFMGTPDFARVNLQALCDAGEEIVGVVTPPDKPKGRGLTLTPCDVKKYALERGLAVYQPVTLKDGAFLDTLKELNPQLIVVVAYGKLLPKYILDYPEYGCVNGHASILPEYRGAAPIQRAIIDGKTETGVSIQRMDVGLDTGDVIWVEKVKIEENDDFEAVHDKLSEASSKALLKTVQLLKDGNATYTPQGDEYTYAEKITKDDCYIDFKGTAQEIHNRIRGLSPIPLSFTKNGEGRVLKIVKAHISDKVGSGKIGEVVALDTAIHVSCGEGVIALDTVVPEGKGRMNARDLINGRKIAVGDILG